MHYAIDRLTGSGGRMDRVRYRSGSRYDRRRRKGWRWCVDEQR